MSSRGQFHYTQTLKLLCTMNSVILPLPWICIWWILKLNLNLHSTTQQLPSYPLNLFQQASPQNAEATFYTCSTLAQEEKLN